MRIERVGEVTDELVAAFARLAPQLSSATPPTREELQDLVADPRSHLLVARDETGIVGSLTFVVYRIPVGGLRGRIDDVVVDEAARGQGIGEALTREAQRIGNSVGVGSISLTSRPSREAANRLYRRLGFEQRETNVYVWRPE